jgi:hypothetical protein
MAGGWRSLGGGFTTGPAAASWGPGRLDVFGRGEDNALWHAWFENGRWSHWESLGGGLTSRPAAASRGRRRLDVFARGTDNALWHRWFDGDDWSGWESLGGELDSGAAATAWPTTGFLWWRRERVDVFARGIRTGLMQRTFTGKWGEWEQIWPLPTKPIWDPAATSWGKGRIDLCWRDAIGQILHKTYEETDWTTFTAIGGGLALEATTSPAIASWGPGRLDCFTRGPDEALWHKAFDGRWGEWESLGGIVTAGPAATSWGPGRIDVFVRGTDGAFWQRTFENGAWT